jgi:alcohol dehydrogenase (cytochrome c)
MPLAGTKKNTAAQLAGSASTIRRNPMSKRFTLPLALFASTMLTATGPSFCAEVTPDRLVNADREPQNWLMNHRTYDAQRYSPLDRIDKNNVKNLKLAYAVALGGASTNMNLESTPLAEDGYLYIVDQWGVLYKIDGRSG